MEFKALGEVGDASSAGSGHRRRTTSTPASGRSTTGEIYTYYGTAAPRPKSFVSSELRGKPASADPGDLVIAATERERRGRVQGSRVAR